MADNSAAKNHLNLVENTLNDITKPDSINTSIASRSLDLFRNLSSENLFVDADILESLQDIRDTLNNLWPQAAAREGYLNAQIMWLPAGAWWATARANLISEQTKVHQISTSTLRATRYDEYNRLYTYANYFNLWSNLDELDINTTAIATSTRHTINLDGVYKKHAGDPTPAYALCNESWNEIGRINPTYSNYKLNIGWQEYTLWWIRYNWGNLDCSTMTITPALKSSPQEITLSINAIYDSNTINVRNVNVVCNKKIKLKLNDWTVVLNDAARWIEFDNYNNALPIWHKIENIIETNFNWNIYNLERATLSRILEKNWGTQYATLNDAQKEDFYQRIRHMNSGGTLYFDDALRTENIDTDINRFNEFRTWFIDNGRDWNKEDNIKSNHNYITFIHNNVSWKVWDFISSKLDHFLWDITQETLLKSELTSFINEIEENKLDNDNTIYGDINRYASHPSHQMDGKRHWYEIWRSSDANYMRFFSWSSTSLKWETVDIHTNTNPDDIGNAEPLKYDMDVNISWKNNIEIEIKIEWEKNPIRIKSWDPAALVRKIMRDCRIKHWKARAHMWFNIYKAMIKMAKENNISLQYRDSSNHTRYIDINDWNILVREVDNLVYLWRWWWRTIFDQEKFINSNQFNRYGENRSLRTWIDELWKHFTLAMNQLHDQYRHWVERKFWTLKYIRSNSTMNFPTSFWSSPIKKLLNFRDTTNFDFNATITSKWKNIIVNLEKNKFTVNMDWLDKPLESKDLWKILNKRKKGNRIFDGLERDIVEWVYVALIGKLRENWKIANTDFWVMDTITWNMYVLDTDWRFWVIARENLDMVWSPLRKWEYWRLNHRRLGNNTIDRFDHGSTEERELMKNPFLMQRFVKAMNKRLGQW